MVACSSSPKEKAQLTEADKLAIENYAKALVNSINQGDHSLIRNSFKYEAFPGRVQNLSRSEQGVLDYIFDRDVKDNLKYHNVDLINQIQYSKGKVHQGKISHHDNHSEIQLILQFDGVFDFVKYRVEMINGKPYLVDYYYLKEESWYSESIKNFILISSEYNSLSNERRVAYTAFKRSQEALYDQDTLGALYYLNQVPESHWVGHGVSLTKLRYAVLLGDSIYATTLQKEATGSQSLFIQYQWAKATEDTAGYLKHLDRIMTEVGNNNLVNSLIEQGLVWF